jgi:hypothetical protein
MRVALLACLLAACATPQEIHDEGTRHALRAAHLRALGAREQAEVEQQQAWEQYEKAERRARRYRVTRRAVDFF